MTAFLTREEVLERLEGDDCGLSLGEDNADFNKVGICGYMAKGDNALSLAGGTTVPVFGMEAVDY